MRFHYHAECPRATEQDDELLIEYDSKTCKSTGRGDREQYNVGCKISFRCRNDAKIHKGNAGFMVSEEGKNCFCMEDGTWDDNCWPACKPGNC